MTLNGIPPDRDHEVSRNISSVVLIQTAGPVSVEMINVTLLLSASCNISV